MSVIGTPVTVVCLCSNDMAAEEMSPLRTSSPVPLEPSDGGTLSVSQECPSSALHTVPLDKAVYAWIDHLKRGGNMPERDNLVGMLEALVVSRVPRPMPTAARADMDVRMVIVDTSRNRKFPHMVDTQNGGLAEEDAIWTQCKTKMTHFCVRLVNANGDPVKGTTVQEGGLKLRLTLHKVSDAEEAMDDDWNPRPSEGLFLGRASRQFEPEVCMMEGLHEFRCQVLLLSSDIGGGRMFLKVAPTDPHLALNPRLVVHSRSFISRARMPEEYAATNAKNNAKRHAAASQLLTMALHIVDSQELSPPASVDLDTLEESPSKRHCSPASSETAQTDTP